MGARPIEKLLIANRGEIAVRILRTCKELNIRTVAVYSDVDREMPHVVQADEAYCIGPAPARESYLSIDSILSAAQKSKADAIHPGYGFLAENETFARRVNDAGFIFVGPLPESIKAMGDKVEARRLVAKAGVPVVPGTDGTLKSDREARDFAENIGLPVLIKAAAGGGGKGMRIVRTINELPSAFKAAQSEALSSFDDGRVYIEKYLENPRHIEFQIIADELGNAIHLGERECTIQRRHQKIIEETPSVIVDDSLREKMGLTAVKAAQAVNYRNAGTIEFLIDKHRRFYFLEMNTRLQVEHPITELRTGIDIVALQLRVAMGERLPFEQDEIRFRGHSIECRVYAEDPMNDFLPSTGTVDHLRPSQGFGIREDRGIDEGDAISIYYDPMISKLCAWGSTRGEALQRMKRALREYEILGVRTNIPLNLFVLGHPKFVEGEFDTDFVSQHFRPDLLEQPSEVEQQAAACVVALIHHDVTQMASRFPAFRSERQGEHSAAISPNGGSTRWRIQRLENMGPQE